MIQPIRYKGSHVCTRSQYADLRRVLPTLNSCFIFCSMDICAGKVDVRCDQLAGVGSWIVDSSGHHGIYVFCEVILILMLSGSQGTDIHMACLWVMESTTAEARRTKSTELLPLQAWFHESSKEAPWNTWSGLQTADVPSSTGTA